MKFETSELPPITRKMIFQEDEHANFIVNYTVSVFNNKTKKNCAVGNTFMRYDDHIVLHRQFTKKLHLPEVRICIRINHELLVKFFTKFLGPLSQ